MSEPADARTMSTPLQVIPTTTTPPSLPLALASASAASTVTPYSTQVVATQPDTAHRPSLPPVSAPMFGLLATSAAPLHSSPTHLACLFYSILPTRRQRHSTFSQVSKPLLFFHCPTSHLLQTLNQSLPPSKVETTLSVSLLTTLPTIGAAATSSSIYRYVSPLPLVAHKQIHAKSSPTFGSRAVANGTTTSTTPTPISSIQTTSMQHQCCALAATPRW